VCLGATLIVTTALTCGGRSELEVPPPLSPQPECDVDADCPGSDNGCQPTICIDTETYDGQLPELPAGIPVPARICLVLESTSCDDNDPCTAEVCNAETGDCEYSAATLDLDGDGHAAPLPGAIPGELGSCGDDCNDASAAAYPGAVEICDGVDNDCNGVVDDGATFVPLQQEPLRVSGDVAPSGPGGLAFNGESYLSVYTGTSTGFDVYATRIDMFGNKIEPAEQPVAPDTSDSAGGPLIWVGDRYGLAWQDRRFGNYEMFFALLAPDGTKATPDIRLSDAPGFSINSSMAWSGSDFYVVWQDDRAGLFDVYAQRVNVYGEPIGDNVRLTPEGVYNDEAPTVAVGANSLGLAYANGQAGLQLIRFQAYDLESLQPTTEIVEVTGTGSEAVYPSLVWNEDRYLVTWYDRTASVKAIHAATLSEDGVLIDGPTVISSPGVFRSRYPTALPLGDRALLIYADDRDQNTGYELYSRMITATLEPITEEQRLTTAAFDSIYPVAAFGPDGNVGVLFRDDRLDGEHHVWFTQLGCVSSPP